MNRAKRILLVDDDEDDRILFKHAVYTKGIVSEVIIAVNGKEALDILERESQLPDIIFMDINMPIMNGIESLTEIRKRQALKNIKVIMISTAVTEDMEERMRELGAQAFSFKPVSFDALADMIAGHINFLIDAEG